MGFRNVGSRYMYVYVEKWVQVGKKPMYVSTAPYHVSFRKSFGMY